MPRELASKTLTWKKMREVVGSTLWEMQNFVCHEKSVFSGDVALQQNNNDKKNVHGNEIYDVGKANFDMQISTV